MIGMDRKQIQWDRILPESVCRIAHSRCVSLIRMKASSECAIVTRGVGVVAFYTVYARERGINPKVGKR